MTFTCTYRTSNGTLSRKVIDATSRADAFTKLKGMHIQPVSLTEGGRLTDEQFGVCNPKPKDMHSPYVRGIVGGLVVVLLVGFAWWFLAGRANHPKQEQRKSAVPKVKTLQQPKTITSAKPVVTKSEPVSVTTQSVEQIKTKQKVEEDHQTVSIHTNNLGKVVEKWRTADGKLHMSVRYAQKPVFDNASDDQLAMAISGNGMQAIAPIPMTATSEKEFLESLKKPIIINDDDSEKVKALKQAVIEARANMKEMIDSGMSYKDALAEHQKLVNENAETRNKLMAELKALVESGDKKEAEHFMKTMNVALGQVGIPELTMPRSREELNEARRQRREELQRQREAAANRADH